MLLLLAGGLVLSCLAYCGRCLGVFWRETGGRRRGRVGLHMQTVFARRGRESPAGGFQKACGRWLLFWAKARQCSQASSNRVCWWWSVDGRCWRRTRSDFLPWLMLYIMIVRMSKASKPHDHQLHKEQDENRHKADTLHPRVLCDRPC